MLIECSILKLPFRKDVAKLCDEGIRFLAEWVLGRKPYGSRIGEMRVLPVFTRDQ